MFVLQRGDGALDMGGGVRQPENESRQHLVAQPVAQQAGVLVAAVVHMGETVRGGVGFDFSAAVSQQRAQQGFALPLAAGRHGG